MSIAEECSTAIQNFDIQYLDCDEQFLVEKEIIAPLPKKTCLTNTKKSKKKNNNLDANEEYAQCQSLLNQANLLLNSTEEKPKEQSKIRLFMNVMASKIEEADLSVDQLEEVEETVLSCVNRLLRCFRNSHGSVFM